MKYSTGERRSRWFWVGVVLLSSSSLLWLIFIIGIAIDPEDAGLTILVGVIIAAIPIGIGVCLVSPGVRRQLMLLGKRFGLMVWVGRYSVTIDAPREMVWTYVSTFETLGLWWPAALQGTGELREQQEFDVSVDVPVTGPGVWTTWSQEVRGVVAEVDPQRKIVLLARGRGRDTVGGRNVLTLEDTKSGCRVKLSQSASVGAYAGVPALDIFFAPLLILLLPITWAIAQLLSYVWPLSYLSPLHELKTLAEREARKIALAAGKRQPKKRGKAGK